MAKFQNKYRIESTRLKVFDYRSQGVYFITICTDNREHFFGEIINGEMKLSEIGKIAFQFWKEIPDHFQNSSIDEFIIMPDHIHGIILLSGSFPSSSIQTSQCDVSTLGDASTNEELNLNQKMKAIIPKPGSISVIIRSFKSATSKHARKLNPEFNWQERFYDRIIRNEREFLNVKTYIKNNPSKWKGGQWVELF